MSSVPFGGTYVLDHLRRRLKVDQIVGRVGQHQRGRRRDMTVTERVLFGLVAFTGPTGLFRQVTALTKPPRDLLAKLAIPAPKQVVDLQPAPR